MSYVNCICDIINLGINAIIQITSAFLFNSKSTQYNWRELFLFLKFNNSNASNIFYYDFKEYPHKLQYIFKINYKLNINDFEANKITFANFLNVDINSIEFELVNNYLYLTYYKDITISNFNPSIHKSDGFKVVLGYNKNELRYFDFLEASNSHIFLGASTRGGKSNLIRLILSQLIQFSKRDIELSIINPKIVDFVEFENVKNIVHYTESVEADQVADILEDNLEEMHNRYKLFKRLGVKNLKEYRKIKPLPLRVIVIDELATFTDQKIYKDFHNALTQLSNKGAGAGILLLLSSQILNKDIMSNQVRQNLNTVFGGRCKDSIKSDMIVEGANLHLIKKVGQFKIFDIDSQPGGDLTQILYIDNQTVKNICNKHIKKPLKGRDIYSRTNND